jgi:hypothetical protein
MRGGGEEGDSTPAPATHPHDVVAARQLGHRLDLLHGAEVCAEAVRGAVDALDGDGPSWGGPCPGPGPGRLRRNVDVLCDLGEAAAAQEAHVAVGAQLFPADVVGGAREKAHLVRVGRAGRMRRRRRG